LSFQNTHTHIWNDIAFCHDFLGWKLLCVRCEEIEGHVKISSRGRWHFLRNDKISSKQIRNKMGSFWRSGYISISTRHRKFAVAFITNYTQYRNLSFMFNDGTSFLLLYIIRYKEKYMSIKFYKCPRDQFTSYTGQIYYASSGTSSSS